MPIEISIYLKLSVLLFALASGLTYLLVPLNIRLSKKLGLLDHPHIRGIHHNAVPLAGGLALAFPILLIQIGMTLFYKDYSTQLAFLTLAGLCILTLGFFDDKKGFTARYKLIFQIIIVLMLFFAGFRIDILTNPLGDSLNLGILSLPLTLIWFLLIINAFNLIDGLDGLASGIALQVALVLFIVGLLNRNLVLSLLSVILAGSCGAFLRFNFYPARIFLGDTGSMFIGLEIASISVLGSAQFKGITAMTLLIPISVAILPLTDTFMAIIRRLKQRKHIFQGDKEHIHHKLLHLGLSQKTIALISYFITFLFGLVALGFSLASKKILFLLLVFMLIILISAVLILFKKEFRK
ncbi:MAG: undecaprenyl/decaprenyl-phosphate alpha-N-acetylglucosaminyl 1-phosphate transferase [Candidatus Cloacimonetes bacterium]|nr:undecaprenyl/decaprenyl-phosphate alpha-N-acetylglucosaminyl 1-phosphate transferase [Candidatus Cloacimonadota bacterium]